MSSQQLKLLAGEGVGACHAAMPSSPTIRSKFVQSYGDEQEEEEMEDRGLRTLSEELIRSASAVPNSGRNGGTR